MKANSSCIRSFDERRNIAIPGDAKETVQFCVDQFIEIAQKAIAQKGVFTAALSGGSTPKAIFQGLAVSPNKHLVDWTKVYLFWSDERSVPPEDPESNYHMAMESGIKSLPIPADQIFRMKAEDDIQENAQEYEDLILKHVPQQSFDLVMLGMGDDGHTASLFPKTHGLQSNASRLVIANYVPQKNTWRMSFTYHCINKAHHTVIYVIGAGKAEMLQKVLTEAYDPSNLPIQQVGTPEHKALFIADQAAAQKLRTERT